MDCRIERIEIVSFGKLQNRVIELDEGMNVLTAPNESGKSTLAAFLRFVFYGFPDARKKELIDNDKKLYTPWDAPKCEGSVTVTCDGRQLRAYRSVTGNKEICLLTDVLSGRQLPDAEKSGEALFGVSEEVFGRTLFFKQLTLPSGKDGVMAEQLQNIAVSADEQVGSRRALDRLTKAKNELKGRAGSGIIPRLEKEAVRLEDALAQARQEHEEIASLRADHQKQTALLAENEQKQALVQAELQNLTRYEAAQKLAQLATLEQSRDDAHAAYMTARQACKGATPEILRQAADTHAMYEKACAKAEAAYDALQNASAPKKEIPELPTSKTGNILLITGIVLAVLGIALSFVLLPVGVALLPVGVLLAVLGLVSKHKQKQARDAANHTAQQHAWDEHNALQLVYEQAKEHADALQNTLAEKLLPFGIDAEHIRDLQNACTEADKLYAAFEGASRAVEIAFQGIDTDALRTLAAGAKEPARDRNAVELEQRFLSGQARMVGDKANQIGNRIAALEGRCADPALLEGKLDVVTRALGDARRKYDAYEAARAGIEEAADEMKRMVAPRLAEIAGKYFAAATGGTYGGMQVDTRLAMTFYDQNGIARETDFLSAGTRDIAYLALRLSLAELLYGECGMPFVWDDAFGRLDDTRLSHVLRTLYAVSQKHQILLLCCTDREEALLAKAGLPYKTVTL